LRNLHDWLARCYVTSDADFENRKAILMGDATFERMKKAKENYHPKAMSIPGVHATSIGVKRVAGKPTDTLAIVVHVREKKSLDDVPLGERISKEIEGFPTDVIAHDLPTPCDDTGNYRPVLGGIQIRVQDTLGTLGCIVQDNNDKSICILSNEHVLLKENEVVYQPKDKTKCQTIGRTKRLRLSKYVDGGIASLDNVVNFAKIVDIGNVTGIHEATSADLSQTMRKRGKTTGLTTAPLLYVNYNGAKRPDNTEMWDQLVIGNFAGKAFMGHGDSGSVAVNDKDEVIGLLWGVVEAEGC
jgi:hypothetical protein